MKTIAYIALLSVLPLIASPQGRQERKESAEPVEVPGGATFQAPVTLDAAFETVLNGLKRHQVAIDSADKELGRIVTAMTITGGYSQTGSRVIVIFIKESSAATTVRVTATTQKRKKLLQTEPWSSPKLDAAGTARAAQEIKALFGLE